MQKPSSQKLGETMRKEIFLSLLICEMSDNLRIILLIKYPWWWNFMMKTFSLASNSCWSKNEWLEQMQFSPDFFWSYLPFLFHHHDLFSSFLAVGLRSKKCHNVFFTRFEVFTVQSDFFTCANTQEKSLKTDGKTSFEGLKR